MALTPFRWIALAVGGVLIVSTILFRPRAERPSQDPRESLVVRERLLGAKLWRTADAVRGRQVADSVRSALARLPKPDTSRLLFDRAVPAALVPYMTRMGRRDIADRPVRPRVPVDVVFVIDTVATVLGIPRAPTLQTRVDYVLPRAEGERCVVIARVMRTRPDMRFARRQAPRLLGPCGFYERFGMPGPRVDRWLMSGGWLFGRSAAFVLPASPWLGPYVWIERQSPFVRQLLTLAGYRCLAGDRDTCIEVTVTAMERLNPPEITIAPPIVSTNTVSEWSGWRPRSLGPAEGRLLGDMARDLGAERFERFWTSGEAVTEAFRGAAGRDLGDWVTAWATSVYGEYGRGPAVPPSGVALGLGLVAVSLSGAAVAARRRQVH